MEKACCFTGHREIPEDEIKGVMVEIRKSIDNTHSLKDITTFYA